MLVANLNVALATAGNFGGAWGLRFVGVIIVLRYFLQAMKFCSSFFLLAVLAEVCFESGSAFA
jgi:hypothetical protein